MNPSYMHARVVSVCSESKGAGDKNEITPKLLLELQARDEDMSTLASRVASFKNFRLHGTRAPNVWSSSSLSPLGPISPLSTRV